MNQPYQDLWGFVCSGLLFATDPLQKMVWSDGLCVAVVWQRRQNERVQQAKKS